MQKLITGFITIPIIGGTLHFIITAILAGLLAVTYSSLTQEKLIATLSFDKEVNQSKVYNAHLYSADGLEIGNYLIYGDQWRIDAGFIKMEYWANILGIDSKYTLNRLEGRYKNINDENTQTHKAYQLESHSLIENFDFFFDTTYGASVYQNIQLKTKYKVLKTETGLMVREESFPTQNSKSLLNKAKALFGY